MDCCVLIGLFVDSLRFSSIFLMPSYETYFVKTTSVFLESTSILAFKCLFHVFSTQSPLSFSTSNISLASPWLFRRFHGLFVNEMNLLTYCVDDQMKSRYFTSFVNFIQSIFYFFNSLFINFPIWLVSLIFRST